MSEYPKVEDRMKEFLSEVKGKFNIIIDGWMDSSSHHFFGIFWLISGIVCSFLYKNKIESLSIGFEYTLHQKAIDLEDILVKCLRKFEIDRRINCFVSDNGKEINIIYSICKPKANVKYWKKWK